VQQPGHQLLRVWLFQKTIDGRQIQKQRGDPPGSLGAGAAGLPQVPQLQRLLEDLRGGAPGEIHRSVGKESGEPLSFSKKNWWHNQVTHWFIVEYNLPYLVATT